MARAELEERLARFAGILDARMLELLAPETTVDAPPAALVEAMRYAALGAGKRIRPFLLAECAGLFGIPWSGSVDLACAVEFFHCYSLVLDDLPAMDDSPLRRGRPALHRSFGEAVAILAANSLAMLAFEIIGRADKDPVAQVGLVLSRELARSAGWTGMAGGQALDLAPQSSGTVELALVQRIHSLKTGALVRYACFAGALLGHADDAQVGALSRYGSTLGLILQISDDLLDVVGTEDSLGKGAGQDAPAGKPTYLAAVGERSSRQILDSLAADATRSVASFGNGASTLRELVFYVVTRTH